MCCRKKKLVRTLKIRDWRSSFLEAARDTSKKKEEEEGASTDGRTDGSYGESERGGEKQLKPFRSVHKHKTEYPNQSCLPMWE